VISREQTAKVSAEVFDAWSRWLKREHRERPGLVHEEALALLGSLGLVERAGDGALRLHAAAARYSPQAEPAGFPQAEAGAAAAGPGLLTAHPGERGTPAGQELTLFSQEDRS
jgi:hypothetical protein